MLGREVAGDSDAASYPRRVQFPARGRVVAVAAGARHVLAATSEAVVYGWGSNASGQLDPSGAASARNASLRTAPITVRASAAEACGCADLHRRSRP